MGNRKTESRIPAGLQAQDLGEPHASPDGKFVLVSFITAPLVEGRENNYVVFITDSALATGASKFEWSFTENAGAPVTSTTDAGEIAYKPLVTGSLSISLRILDTASAELAKLDFTQAIGPLNPALEAMIVEAANSPGPGIGNVEVIRELVNDHNPYYNEVGEAGTGFRDFLFGMACDGVLKRKPEERKALLDKVAASLNDGSADFATASGAGLGVCHIRLSLAAMLLNPGLLPYTELPEPPTANAVADEQLRRQLAEVTEDDRIDLFNRTRFPKSNIVLCGLMLEALRDKFFAGVSFNDVMTKMNGTMADWILLNYKKGPLLR